MSQATLAWHIGLAEVFVMKGVQFIGGVYLLAIVVVVIKIAILKPKHGWSELLNREKLLEVSYPYCSVNFLLLSIRRALAVFGIIFFFLHLKHIILFIHRANFDLFYWDLDRKIHFGVQPNVWAMVKYGLVHDLTVLVDWLYIKYFAYKLIVCTFFMLELKGREISEKFFTAYALCWALGGLGYLVAPADGPCYAVLGGHSIDVQDRSHIFQYPVTNAVPPEYIENYKESKIWYAKEYQRTLWKERHVFIMGKRFPGMFYGIAAMPSLHVAAVVFIAIFVTQVSPIAGIFAWIFAGVTLFGSVLLQWHYAVDGYVGIVLAIVVSIVPLLFPKRFYE